MVILHSFHGFLRLHVIGTNIRIMQQATWPMIGSIYDKIVLADKTKVSPHMSAKESGCERKSERKGEPQVRHRADVVGQQGLSQSPR